MSRWLRHTLRIIRAIWRNFRAFMKQRRIRWVLYLAIAALLTYVIVPRWIEPAILGNRLASNADHTLSAVAPTTGYAGPTQTLDPVPPAQPIPGGNQDCLTFFGDNWTTQLQPTIQNYLKFPSAEAVPDKLAALQPNVTADFYAKTKASWLQTVASWGPNGTPPVVTTDAQFATCWVTSQIANQIVLNATLNLVSSDGSPTLIYDNTALTIFVQAKNGQPLLVGIEPAGSLVIPAGGDA